jgi:hypothetical protein
MSRLIVRRTSPFGTVSDRLLVGLLVARAVNRWVTDALISASLAALAIPFATAVAGIDMLRDQPSGLPRLLASWSFHTTPRDRVRRAGAAGMALVRGPAAAWHSGMS